jgi:hypothetical protein
MGISNSYVYPKKIRYSRSNLKIIHLTPYPHRSTKSKSSLIWTCAGQARAEVSWFRNFWLCRQIPWVMILHVVYTAARLQNITNKIADLYLHMH